MNKILISACLLGRKVRYDGQAVPLDDDLLDRWAAEGRLVPICPEVVGGLPVPRPPAEIQGPGDGHAVLDAAARVVADDGRDVTDHFLEGARRALALARSSGARLAILKARSPSCGNREIYDGTFSGARIPGQGVTVALLEREGIPVFNEDELDRARAYLESL